MTRLTMSATLASIVMLGGCTSRAEKDVNFAKAEEEALQHASGAVNEVLRNAVDCDVAKPLVPEATQRIAEARKAVRAQASHATLDSLQLQLDRVVRGCS